MTCSFIDCINESAKYWSGLLFAISVLVKPFWLLLRKIKFKQASQYIIKSKKNLNVIQNFFRVIFILLILNMLYCSYLMINILLKVEISDKIMVSTKLLSDVILAVLTLIYIFVYFAFLTVSMFKENGFLKTLFKRNIGN